MDKTSNKYHVLLVCVALTLAIFIAFEPVRHNHFVDYDDDDYVTNNPHVQEGITLESVVWAFTTSHVANWHPLTWLSHMLDCELFDVNPLWHHLTNLLFHIANTLLLFWVLKRMTGTVCTSAFVAAAFALHPLHVESVAWVAERKDVLSGFFWMLTIAAYVRYTERPRIGRYMLVFLALGLGLLAKSMLVTLPFVLLLLDYWPLGRFQWASQGCKKALPQPKSDIAGSDELSITRLVVEKIPLFVLAAASSAVTYTVQQKWGAMEAGQILPLNIRISNALVSYFNYIGKMVYPSRLAVLYPHPADSLPVWRPIVFFIILIGLTAVIIYAGRRRRYLAVGWLWYLGTLVPVIGLVQVGAQAMADRYTYLPSIGFFIMVAWGAAELFTKWRYRKIMLGTSAGLLIVILVICTRTQVRYWQNTFTLFGHAIEATENNFFMHYALGNALRSQDKLDEAAGHYRQALHIKPDYAQAHNNLAVVLKSQSNLEEAISHYNQALQIKSDFAEAHYNLGNALSAQDKLNESIHHHLQAVQIKPDYAEAHYNLGIAFKSQDKLDESIYHYLQALHVRPNDIETRYNLGNALLAKGELDEAIRNYRQVLQLNPDYAKAHNNIGNALVKQGKLDEAVSHYRRALQIEPDFATARNNLEIVLKSQGKSD